MECIVMKDDIFRQKEYHNEKDFEQAVIHNYKYIFGTDTVYIDIKKRIGDRERSIPDGYLLDFSFPTDPRLYIIENELSVHDTYKHISSQLLRFADSYRTGGRDIKKHILHYLAKSPDKESFVESKLPILNYRNIDALLEYLIFEKPVSIIVVIDDNSSELRNVLRNIAIKTLVIEFKTFQNRAGELLHKFIPLNDEIKQYGIFDMEGNDENGDICDIDTIVVPAQEDGFQQAFIGRNAWWQIRISSSMLEKIKYIAAYRTAPISAITHVAEVQRIERYKDTNKYILIFKGPAKEIHHIRLDEGSRGKAPQSARYTNYKKLMAAQKLSDVF